MNGIAPFFLQLSGGILKFGGRDGSPRLTALIVSSSHCSHATGPRALSMSISKQHESQRRMFDEHSVTLAEMFFQHGFYNLLAATLSRVFPSITMAFI